MTYTKRGTQLIATLLVAIMVLSVFAMPVAASSVNEKAEFTYDADEVDDSQQLTESFNITFGNDNADDGDEINVTFDGNIQDEEDFSLDDANFESVDQDTGGIEGEDNVSVDTVDSGADLDGDDRIVIELDFDGDDGVNVEDNEIEISVDLTATEQAASKAADYDDTNIAEVTDDDTGHNLDDAAVDVSIDPGVATDLNLDLDDNEAAFDADDVTATAQVVDAQDNLNESADAHTQVNFTVTGVEFDESEDEQGTSNGEVEIGLEADGDIDWKVGTFTVDIEEDDSQAEPLGLDGDADDLWVYPDDVEADLGDSTIDADEESDLTVTIEDGEFAIEDEDIDQLDVEVNLTDFDPDDGDVDEPRLAELDGEALNTTIEDAEFDGNGENTTEFNGTTAGEYDIEANALPAVDDEDTIDDDTIDVEPVDEISAIESVEVEHDLVGVVIDDNNDVDVDIEGIEDAFENNITGSENDVQIEVGDIDEQDGASDGSATVTFDPEDIDAAEVGEDDVIAQDVSDQDELESTTIFLEHEAYDADSGWNLVSVPMDADSVATEDMSELFYWTGEEYLPLSEADQPLHHGYYTEAESSDARWGMTFNTTEDPSSVGGIETIDDGWNLVGTNYNISDSATEDIDDDLRGIDDLSNEPRLEANYEGTFVSGSQSVDEFDAYWVFRGSDLGTLEERGLTVAPYDPDSR